MCLLVIFDCQFRLVLKACTVQLVQSKRMHVLHMQWLISDNICQCNCNMVVVAFSNICETGRACYWLMHVHVNTCTSHQCILPCQYQRFIPLYCTSTTYIFFM